MAPQMTRVLHVNHTAVIGGAERSLLALLDHTDRARIAGVSCPPGPLADAIAARDLPWFPTAEPEARFDASTAERLGAVSRLARTGPTVELVARRTRADVVHANSVRTALGVSLSGRRLVTHVRDILPAGRTAGAVKRLVVARSRRIVGISGFVAARFANDLPRPGRWSVVDNPIDLRSFPVRPAGERPGARSALGLDPAVPLALVIGQITPWKRQVLAVEALAAAHDRGVRLQLAVVGSVAFTQGRTGDTNRAYETTLRDRIAELGLDDAVVLLGQRGDVGELLAAADLVLVPSVDEPFGRVVAEAIASGVPVLSSPVGGPADVLARCGGGAVVPGDEPAAWGAALERLLGDGPDATAEHGIVAPAAVARVRAAFDAGRHAEVMAGVFDGAGG
jgi:glycosyltransferase involved in cell wall biosynthesis